MLFSHTLTWIQTHRTELTVMGTQRFLPLPLQYKISLSRAEEATSNILNHL